MHILLTGGSGAVGKAVVSRLVRSGHSVRVIGRSADISFEGAEYRVCDINEYSALREAMRGCDHVVHLAAVPNPGKASPEELFRVNATGTFNVFQAATELGIRRVVQASSINATGQFYGSLPAPLHYLPIDEEHPVFSTDAYSFSKHVIEEIGEYFWRREGISSVALRLPWVAPAAVHDDQNPRRSFAGPLIGKMFDLNEEQRRQWFETAWKTYNEFRAGRPYEIPDGGGYKKMSELPEETRIMLSMMGYRVNFFTMVDERDSAQSIEKGLTADYEGAHALFINDSQNWTGIDSSALAALFYQDVKVFKKPLSGTDTLVSIDKARRLIGFEPEYSYGRGS